MRKKIKEELEDALQCKVHVALKSKITPLFIDSSPLE